jgi:bacteriocin-like protein
MKNNITELSMNEMAQVNGGFFDPFTIGIVTMVVLGTAATVIQIVKGDEI